MGQTLSRKHVGVSLFKSFVSSPSRFILHPQNTSPLPCHLPPPLQSLLTLFSLYLLSLSLSLLPSPNSANKIPSLTDLRTELDNLITELQTAEADTNENDATDEDSSSTEVSSLSSLELSDREQRNAPAKQIDQLKRENDQFVQSLGLILNSQPSPSRPSLHDSSENKIVFTSEFIDAATDVVTAVETMNQITHTLENVNLNNE